MGYAPTNTQENFSSLMRFPHTNTIITQTTDKGKQRRETEKVMDRTSGNVPYKCGICLLTFSHHEDLKQHKKMHIKLYPRVRLGRKLPINVGQGHPSVESYDLTQRRQDDILTGGEKQISESMESQKRVNSTNSQPEALETRHMSDMHSVDTTALVDRESESAIYFCNGCGELFDCKQHLKNHLEGHHKVFTCRICSSRFTGVYFLQHHMAVHREDEGPFVCGICGKKFSRKGMLLQHLQLCNAKARENFQQGVNLASSHPQTSKPDSHLSQESREVHPPTVALDTAITEDLYRVIQVKVEDDMCTYESYEDEISEGIVADESQASQVSSTGRPAEPDELPPTSSEESDYPPGATLMPQTVEETTQSLAGGTYSYSDQKSPLDGFYQSSEASVMLNAQQHMQPSNQYSTNSSCGPTEVDHLNTLMNHIGYPEDDRQGDPAKDVGFYQRRMVQQGYQLRDRVEKDNRHDELILQTADSMFYACEMSPSSSSETDALASVDSAESLVESTCLDGHPGGTSADMCATPHEPKETMQHVMKSPDEKMAAGGPCNDASSSTLPSKRVVCKVCHKVFPSVHHLTRHMRLHSAVKPYYCSLCPKSFKWESSLKAHMISHKRMLAQKELKQKKQSHSKKQGGTHLCNVCGKVSSSRTLHTKHMRLHSNDKPYLCKLCPRRFKWHSSMVAHSKSHNRAREMIGGISNQDGEAQHKRDDIPNATNVLVSDQPVTRAIAASEDNLLVPSPAQEAVEAFPKNVDEELASKTSSASDLPADERKHFETTTDSGGEEQVALPCNTKSGLVSQGYMCNICHKVSTTSHQHRRHLRRHTADLPYSCKLCPKKFKWHSSLAAHSKSHKTGRCSSPTTDVPSSPQKGFTCNICHKVSLTSNHHRRHQRLHTGDTPFSCHLCPRKFKWCSSLAAHFKSHENERQKGLVHGSHELTEGDKVVKGNETHSGVALGDGDGDGVQETPPAAESDAPCTAVSGQHQENSVMTSSRDITSSSSSASNGIPPYLVCAICQKPCISKRSLLKHMRSHDEPFAFSCDICGRRFKWLHFLEAHRMSHSRDKEDEVKN